MHITTYILGELQTNCYLISDDRECVIIDPADDASFLLEEISRQNKKLTAMIATHGHFDHIMAAGEIQLSLNIPLYIHRNDDFLVKRLTSTAKHFLGYEPVIFSPHTLEYISEGEFQISKFKFQLIHTPGHTPGGLSFYFPEEGVVFTGDTLFKGAVGRTDLSYSNQKDLDTSIRKLIREIPEETIVYPGHGEITLIMNEQIKKNAGYINTR